MNALAGDSGQGIRSFFGMVYESTFLSGTGINKDAYSRTPERFLRIPEVIDEKPRMTASPCTGYKHRLWHMMMPGYTRSVQVPEKCSIFGTDCRK
ncbi:MAG: hypothetical protein STSR0009_18190 [Methanoregula sp.]